VRTKDAGYAPGAARCSPRRNRSLMMPLLNRRTVISALGVAAVLVPISARLAIGQDAGAASITREMILNDPDAPIGGNPKGDVTIVAYLDYNCPFCKKSTPDLDRIVKEDGKIRLVYKDWPILFPTSIYGAQLALAAKIQENKRSPTMP